MKYRKKGVKREHSIIEDFERDLEELVKLGLVDSVIPGRIYTSPKSQAGQKRISYQYETKTGAKLLLKKGSTVQEVFVVCKDHQNLKEYLLKTY